MKIRLTILTGNKIPRPSELTEEQVAKTWQKVLDYIAISRGMDEAATVERAEFVEETK